MILRNETEEREWLETYRTVLRAGDKDPAVFSDSEEVAYIADCAISRLRERLRSCDNCKVHEPLICNSLCKNFSHWKEDI